MIREKAEEFNLEYFDSSIDLSLISFKTSSRMVLTRGTFRGMPKQIITLSALLFHNNEEWQKTLLHEMIHAYQFQNKLKIGHGIDFKNKAINIKIKSKDKYVITRTSSFKDDVTKERIHELRVNSIKTQYVVFWIDSKVNFIKNLSEDDIEALNKYYGAEVYINKNIVTGVRHCKNYKYLIRAKYYCQESILEHLGLELEKV